MRNDSYVGSPIRRNHAGRLSSRSAATHTAYTLHENIKLMYLQRQVQRTGHLAAVVQKTSDS